MSFLDVLFAIIIRPLELLFEFVFSLANAVSGSPSVSLIIMSIAINFLVLPLYRRADVIQQQTREKENSLRPMADHIKKYFKGDERVMLLQTYYRQENYSPLSSLKSLTSLLLQIPFFIAAYRFLSHLPMLGGVKLGPVNDLMAPDALLTVGGITINVLPVIMTVINIISSEIYAKGQPFKSKIVMYVTALVFLVLLYNSPSGLVFYWTLNNLFSLIKNIFYKLKHSGLILEILFAVCGMAGIASIFVFYDKLGKLKFGFLMILFVIMVFPLAFRFLPLKKKEEGDIRPLTKGDKILYLCGSVLLCLITGLLIPSSVVSSSPGDFMFVARLENPNQYVWYTFFVSAGVFIIWLGIFYLLASDKGKKIFAYAVTVLSGIAVTDYLFFGTGFGTLSAELEYDDGVSYARETILINLAVVGVVTVALLLAVRFLPTVTRFIVMAAAIAALGMGMVNVFKTHAEYRDYCGRVKTSDAPVITLSKNGKNVVVFMLDRAIGCLVPYIFQENPKLAKQFDGFVYYPNTISFGGHTNFGAPALFGGYEYTPEEMNKRSNELLKDKHNEALLVMPRLFSENGFHTTVIDPPYVNYSELRELSIYDQYKDINAYLANGVMNPYTDEILIQTNSVRDRNFFFYSLFKVAPVILQQSLYDGGRYRSLNVKYYSEEDMSFHYPQTRQNMSKSTGIRPQFMNAYTVLDGLSGITSITDSDMNCFLSIDNDTAHSPNLLQSPDFVPQEHVDNTTYDMIHSIKVWDDEPLRMLKYNQVADYQVNMAAYVRLGKWFDYLRENEVWDNTRIIIVADHGFNLEHLDSLVNKDLGIDAEYTNPVLMVKDFDCSGFTVSYDFMTNADVPALATANVIDNPVNPFTGKAINDDAKDLGPMHILFSEDWKVSENNGTAFLPGSWYSVHDDIFERSNWEYLGEY